MVNSSVSAVIFCFNEEAYIAKAIESLCAQTVPFQQIIIVDDYSTDKTLQVVSQFLNENNTISLVRNAYAKGKVGAYQTGLQAVQTDYFFVMGADDEASPDLVEFSLEFLKKTNALFFFHSAYLIDEASQPLGSTFISQFNKSTCFYYNQTGGLIFSHKSILETLLPFPEKLEFEDWYTVLTLYMSYGDIRTCSVPKVMYRIHANSDSQASKWDWSRRERLMDRDLRFLKLMLETTPEIKFRANLQHSIRFRERLMHGLPTFAGNVSTSLTLLKTYLSVSISRLLTCLVCIRSKF